MDVPGGELRAGTAARGTVKTVPYPWLYGKFRGPESVRIPGPEPGVSYYTGAASGIGMTPICCRRSSGLNPG